MPLSEFLRLAIEKLESSKQKACAADASSRNENHLVEVVWENGPVHHSLSPNTPNVYDAALGNIATPNLDVDIAAEPIVASSEGHGNIVDGFSYEQTPTLKRKLCDIESESHIDDIQTAPIGVEKPTPARGATEVKRNRSAEVHNLSERRRRDRINEKLRALQELIPNCNKSDKASMLDEAIQYLKNLQHQVQIMSMGGGFYIPPMMYPLGSQHIYPAPMMYPLGSQHILPSGVGMGTSMSYGNMTAGSPLRPIFHGAHFPSGHMSFQGTELPMHGHVCPGFHATVPRAQLVPLTGSHSNALRLSPSQNKMPSTSVDQVTKK